MYEPYGESKGFKFDFSGIKGKIIEKIKNLRQSRWFFVIIAVIIIGVATAYTGFASYTAKITEYDAKLSILDKQLKACNNNVSSCLSGMETTRTDLESFKGYYQTCQDEKLEIETNLQSCKDERNELEVEMSGVQSTISELESKYENLNNNFNNLQGDYSAMEQNYAKGCCNFGFTYYFVKDGIKVVCCSRRDIDFCAEKPENVDLIKDINC